MNEIRSNGNEIIRDNNFLIVAFQNRLSCRMLKIFGKYNIPFNKNIINKSIDEYLINNMVETNEEIIDKYIELLKNYDKIMQDYVTRKINTEIIKKATSAFVEKISERNKENFTINMSTNFIENIKELITKNNFEIDVYKMSEQELKLTSHGVQSHGAHPDLGINAISRLVVILNQIFKQYDISNELFDFFNQYIGTKYDGKSLGINVEDESGKLTLNVGHLSLKDSRLEMGMNIRIPIHTSIDFVKETLFKYCDLYPNLNFCDKHHTPALYIPKDNILITTLCKIFNEVTNLNAEPIAIGGATYARAFKNCVSFGANFPGHKDMCHQTDEFIDIDHLILSCKIYAKAIVELGSENFKIQ